MQPISLGGWHIDRYSRAMHRHGIDLLIEQEIQKSEELGVAPQCPQIRHPTAIRAAQRAADIDGIDLLPIFPQGVSQSSSTIERIGDSLAARIDFLEDRSEEHTYDIKSLKRRSDVVLC